MRRNLDTAIVSILYQFASTQQLRQAWTSISGRKWSLNIIEWFTDVSGRIASQWILWRLFCQFSLDKKLLTLFQSNLPVFRKGDLWLGLIKEKYARKRFFVAFLFALISREEVRSNQKWGFTGTSTTLRLLMNVIGVFSVDLIKILSKF